MRSGCKAGRRTSSNSGMVEVERLVPAAVPMGKTECFRLGPGFERRRALPLPRRTSISVTASNWSYRSVSPQARPPPLVSALVSGPVGSAARCRCRNSFDCCRREAAQMALFRDAGEGILQRHRTAWSGISITSPSSYAMSKRRSASSPCSDSTRASPS
jgi:hypothetical protein